MNYRSGLIWMAILLSYDGIHSMDGPIGAEKQTKRIGPRLSCAKSPLPGFLRSSLFNPQGASFEL
jgi:hypothetical protein